MQLKEMPSLGKEDAHESRAGFTEPQGFDKRGGAGADMQAILSFLFLFVGTFLLRETIIY